MTTLHADDTMLVLFQCHVANPVCTVLGHLLTTSLHFAKLWKNAFCFLFYYINLRIQSVVASQIARCTRPINSEYNIIHLTAIRVVKKRMLIISIKQRIKQMLKN